MNIIKPEKAWLLVGALCVVLGGATLAGCGRDDDDDDDDDDRARNTLVRPGDDDDD